MWKKILEYDIRRIEIFRHFDGFYVKICTILKYFFVLISGVFFLHILQICPQPKFICSAPTCGFKPCYSFLFARSNMRSHQRTYNHHQWQWRCPICNKAFRERRDMDRHQSAACRKYRHNQNYAAGATQSLEE